MSRSGTRRSTIVNRRAGQTARLTFLAKRAALTFGALGLVIYGAHAALTSDWMRDAEIRATDSFNLKVSEAGFNVQNLLIDGRVHIDREQLKKLLGIQKNTSIFAYDLEAIQERLSKISWVKSAIVERRLPDTIYVRLEERVPVALWQRNGKLSLVDSEGFVLADKNLQAFNHMIVITGDNAPNNAAELVGLIRVEPELQDRIEIARWIGNRRWDIKLKNGITLRLPEDDAGFAIKRLSEAQKNEQVLDRQVEAIDLRDPMRIVVQTAPGAVDKYEAGYKKEKNI